jgi:uncharacterized protein with ParB-like and HNH nuclease domain
MPVNFNTSNLTFRQLLGNGLTYKVPLFQRDYSWTEDEWDDLWQDILVVLNDGEEAHYMGYLVLQTSDNRSFNIIDGQQRLTTLSILVLAVLKNLRKLVDANIEADKNQQRMNQLRNAYIGFLDPVTLVPKSKLSLNRNNDSFYQTYIVPLERLPKRLNASENLLKKAFEWISDRIEKKYGASSKGEDLALVIESLSDRLFFTVITVTEELNAFKVFETLNARGVKLSPTDLLKNYLFSVVHRDGAHESEINSLDKRWGRIVDNLGSEKFPDFLRTHWNSRHKFTRLADLFKTIRDKISNRETVFKLLRELEEDLETYSALARPEDRIWSQNQRQYIQELGMFNVRQPFPLLLAAKRGLDDDGFTSILRACSVISFRYNTIAGLATNEQERVYNEVAEKIAAKKLERTNEIIREMRSIYPSDEQFKNAFSEKRLKTTSSRNNRIARYILFKIEKHLSLADYDNDSLKYSLEHVLPENPEDSWEHLTEDEIDQCVYRLGNFTILESSANHLIGNKSFQEKRDSLASSDFKITKEITENYLDWTPDNIAKRQRWMASQATSIWRIDQLS